MSFAKQPRSNGGALFKNDRRKTEEQPGYTGSLDVEGTEFWIKAWVKESKSGQKYFSLAIERKIEGPVRR